MEKTQNKNSSALFIIVGLLIIVGAFSLFKKAPLQKQQAITNEAVAVNASVKTVAVQAKSWEFTPSVITVKQGDRVNLTITSIDVDHGFALPDFGVSANLKPGKTETVIFTADKKGEFTFFCNVFCGAGHKEMKGKLIVE